MIRDRRFRQRKTDGGARPRVVRSGTSDNRTASETTPEPHVSVTRAPRESGIPAHTATVGPGGSTTHPQRLSGAVPGGRIAGLRRGLRTGLRRLRASLAAGVETASPVTVAFAATAILSGCFVLVPDVDLAVSRLFFDPVRGFTAASNPELMTLRKSSSWVVGLTLLALIVVVVRGWRTGREARKALFLITGLALASGVVVNGLFKSLWGRARPVQIEGFGGDAAFTPAWTMTDQCASNCSFVSGEASSAAWLAAAAVVMTPAPWRPILIPLAFAYAAALSFNRLLFGGHFLSDIVLSWAITALVLCLLHRLTLQCPVEARRARVAIARLSTAS